MNRQASVTHEAGHRENSNGISTNLTSRSERTRLMSTGNIKSSNGCHLQRKKNTRINTSNHVQGTRVCPSMSFQKLFYNPIFRNIGDIRATVVQSPKNVDLGQPHQRCREYKK